MEMIFPNKPVEMYASVPKVWEKFEKETGLWAAQQKVDGHRTMIIKDSTKRIVGYKGGSTGWVRGKNKDLFFLSRRDLVKGGPTNIPVSEKIVDMIESLGLPDQSTLDGEWMARRTIGEIPESLFLFDVIWKDNLCMTDLPFKTRHEMLMEIVKDKITPPVVHENDLGRIQNGVLRIPITYIVDFKANFDLQKQIPWTEGLVFKRLDSKIIYNTQKCVDNPGWVKIKWRSGSSGRDVVQGA